MRRGGASQFHTVLLGVISILSNLVQGINYYCLQNGSTVDIVGQKQGNIVTLYNTETTYGNNRDCRWVINAGNGNRIWLEILDSHLQWAPGNAICSGYDYMEVRDGSHASDLEIVTWCGNQKPVYIFSSQKFLFLRFVSNSQNIYSYGGVRLRFGIFSSQECPPVSGEFQGKCVTAVDEPVVWHTAQQHCKWLKSNLLKIDNYEMADFANDLMKRKTKAALYWIGLNDIKQEGVLTWLDGSALTYSRRRTLSISDNDCVCVNHDIDMWEERSCHVDKHPYVCAMNKGGNTILYSTPISIDPSGGPEPPSTPLWVIIASSGVAGVVVIGAIICGCVHFCRKRSKKEIQQEADHWAPDRNRRYVTPRVDDGTSVPSAHIRHPIHRDISVPPASVMQSSVSPSAPPSYEVVNLPLYHYSPSVCI